MAFTQIIVAQAGVQAFESQGPSIDVASLLGTWQETERIELHPDSLSMPFEVAYARALELPSDEGQIPWAAYESGTLGTACAWFHPCHLDVGMTDMVLQPVQHLMLSAAQSREVMELVAPLAAQDGIRLSFHSAQRWLAKGDAFQGIECASLARVQGRSINAWLPDAGEYPQLAKLARLQAEVQMLLYGHPINDARSARRLPAVNSFWIDGAGSLDALPAPSGTITLETRLQDAAQSPSEYAAAWAALLGEWERHVEQAWARGDEFGVTLCGEKSAVTWFAEKPSWKSKVLGIVGQKSKKSLRETL